MAKTFDEWWSENSGKSLDCSRKTVAMAAWGAAAEQAARAAGEERDQLGVVVSAMRGYWSMYRGKFSGYDHEQQMIETFIRDLDRIGQHLRSPKADAQDQQVCTQLDEQLGPGWRQEQQRAIAERMKSPPSPVAGGPGGAERSGE